MNCLILLLLLASNGNQCGNYDSVRDDGCGCDRDDRDSRRDGNGCGCGRDDRDSRRDGNGCGCDRDDRDSRRDGNGCGCDRDDRDSRSGSNDYGRGWDRNNDARPAAWDSDCGCNGPRQGFPGINRNETCGCENQNQN